MDKINTTCEHLKLRIIAAAVGLQQCTQTAANLVPLPDGRYVAIGKPAELLEVLPELRTAVPAAWQNFAQAIADLPDGAEANIAGMRGKARQLLAGEARRSLASGAPAKSSPSAEQTQWRNIQKVVRQVAEFCFGGPQQEGNVSMAAAYLSVINCLTAKDGVDLKLEPLSAGAAAKTEQALGDLTTAECPTCKGYGEVARLMPPYESGGGYDSRACDDCDGQGRVIVSRADMAALAITVDHDHSEGGHVD
jgi:hypothetical protein